MKDGLAGAFSILQDGQRADDIGIPIFLVRDMLYRHVLQAPGGGTARTAGDGHSTRPKSARDGACEALS